MIFLLLKGDPNYFSGPRYCKSVQLSTSNNLNFYFGSNIGPSHLIPNEAIEVLHLDFPQVYLSFTLLLIRIKMISLFLERPLMQADL